MKRRNFLKRAGLLSVIPLVDFAQIPDRQPVYRFEDLFDNNQGNSRAHFLKESPLRDGIIGELRKQNRIQTNGQYYYLGTYPAKCYGNEPMWVTKERCYNIPVKPTYTRKELDTIAADVLEVLARYKYIRETPRGVDFYFFGDEPSGLYLQFSAILSHPNEHPCNGVIF